MQNGIRVIRPIRIRASSQARAEAEAAARAQMDTGMADTEADQVNTLI